MMYSLMLVDDEYMILRGMQKLIDWASFDIKIVRAEKSPKAALEFLKQNQVDILISDMNMAELDGAEFLPAVRACRPDIQIIVLSGYSDFSYAKAGIESGIIDYLEKPVDPDELEEIIQKAIKRIEQSKQKDRLELEHLANKILSGKEKLTEPGQVQLLVCDEELTIPSLTCAEVVMGPIFKEAKKVYLLKQLPEGLPALKGKVVIDREVAINEVSHHYHLMKAAFSRLQFLELDQVYLDLSQEKPPLESSSFWDQIDFRYIANNEFKTLFEAKIQELAQTNLTISGVKKLLRTLLLKLYDNYQVSREQMVEMIAKIDQADRISTIVEVIESEVADYIYHNRKQYPELIEQVLDITREHYEQKLSLSKLSKELNVNNVYLGALFKKHLDKSYAQYLNEFRIARAVELLQDHKLDTNKIAIAVGYPTANYFFKVFKTELGMTPKEYRHQLKEKIG